VVLSVHRSTSGLPLSPFQAPKFGLSGTNSPYSGAKESAERQLALANQDRDQALQDNRVLEEEKQSCSTQLHELHQGKDSEMNKITGKSVVSTRRATLGNAKKGQVDTRAKFHTPRGHARTYGCTVVYRYRSAHVHHYYRYGHVDESTPIAPR
jgi:hypothetical protein